MPVELLISPPATGKTNACIQRIRSLLLDQPFSNVRVVLPDRLQATAFRRRLAEAGGAIGVQIGTFEDLHCELLALTGQPVPIASPSMVHRLVQAAVDQVHAAGELRHYAELRTTPGFALELRDAFAELKCALVYPETFIEQASAGSPAQQELARLYQAYQAQLQRLQWADPEGLSWLAVEALRSDPNLLADLKLLVVDGFDSFTGAQRQALRLLAPRLAHILLTLPGEKPFNRAVNRRFKAAYQQLKSDLQLIESSLPARSFLPAPLQHVTGFLFEGDTRCSAPGINLTLIEVRSPADEAREALRWLKACIVRHAVPLHACAVITPNPDVYHPYLRQASLEFGLPLRFTQGEVLAQSPLVAALLNFLNLPVLNYPRRQLLDVLRCPYFDLSALGLNLRSADVLDEVSRFGQVLEGRQQWEDVFERLAQAPTPLEVEAEDDLQLPSLPRGAQVAPLRLALNRFFDRLAPPDSSAALLEWIRWLEDLLDDFDYFAQGANVRESDTAALEHLRETLRALVLGAAVTGSPTVSYAQFVTELQGALAGVGYQEPLPSGQPAALVARMIEARGVRFQAVAILGLAEGIFPAVERPDPFLDEPLRQSLGLEPRLQREQAGLFYQAVTRSDGYLLLTRPYLAEDGEKWEASPYWKAVLALLPEHAEQTIRPDDPRPLNDAASAEEALFWAVRQRSLPQAFNDLLPRWQYLRHARDLLRARQAAVPDGPHEGYAEPLVDSMRTRYGDEHIWSASRLETYSACPHQFFVTRALRLETKAPPALGLDAAQLGNILHTILKQSYAAPGDPSDPQAVLAVLPEIAHRVFANSPQELGFRPSLLWESEQAQLLQVLANTVVQLAEQDVGAGWRPIAFEQPFGWDGVTPLSIQVDGQTILLYGVVDRIDRDRAGHLRIIDYKTGSSHLSKQDLTFGRRLQLPLYALAAQDTLGLGQVTEGLYWALLKGEAGSLKLSSFRYGDELGLPAAVAMASEHISRIVQGIRQAHFPPEPPRGGCPAYCAVASWCWRYSPGWGA